MSNGRLIEYPGAAVDDVGRRIGIGALVLYGADATTATAAVLIYHAIVLAVPVAVGLVALLLLPRSASLPTVPRTAAE